MPNVKHIMRTDPVTCGRHTPLVEVAKRMVEYDCGAIPVVDPESARLVGIVTDRDIVARSIAEGLNPLEMSAGDVYSEATVTLKPGDRLETAAQKMRQYRVRRIPVVDDGGICVGVVTQAHLAQSLPAEQAGALLRDLSKHTEAPSLAASKA
jgi:CBS domain-containing protein